MVADKVVAIRDATINRLAGRTPEVQDKSWDRGRLFVAATSFFGGLAIVLAAIGFARKEPRRPCALAAALGLAAVVFPYVMGVIGAIIFIMVVGAVLSMLFG